MRAAISNSTTDFRSVLGEVLSTPPGQQESSARFPGIRQ